jgi:tryptophan synthase alpha chain
VKSLETRLRALRDSGRKALVPYFMGGLTPDWTQHVQAAVHAGADAVEIGIPFSDPMMDGAVIQEAALRALQAGTTLDSICADLAKMSFNIFHHYGLERSAGKLQASGFSGAIVPDLALEEADEWIAVCDRHDVATVFLVAPSTTPERVRRLGEATQGFAYASARMAVTGKSGGAGDADRVVRSIRAVTTVPTYIGIGISSEQQAKESTVFGDGVIIGSALVQVILDGAGAGEVETFIRSYRAAIGG